jgi:hypothetical protein
MTPLDLAALRAAAEAVGDEQWTLYMGEEDPIAVVTYDPQPGRRKQVALHPLYPRDKAKAVQRTNYIAAAPPATVLALLDRLARAEAVIARLSNVEQLGSTIRSDDVVLVSGDLVLKAREIVPPIALEPGA